MSSSTTGSGSRGGRGNDGERGRDYNGGDRGGSNPEKSIWGEGEYDIRRAEASRRFRSSIYATGATRRRRRSSGGVTGSNVASEQASVLTQDLRRPAAPLEGKLFDPGPIAREEGWISDSPSLSGSAEFRRPPPPAGAKIYEPRKDDRSKQTSKTSMESRSAPALAESTTTGPSSSLATAPKTKSGRSHGVSTHEPPEERILGSRECLEPLPIDPSSGIPPSLPSGLPEGLQSRQPTPGPRVNLPRPPSP